MGTRPARLASCHRRPRPPPDQPARLSPSHEAPFCTILVSLAKRVGQSQGPLLLVQQCRWGRIELGVAGSCESLSCLGCLHAAEVDGTAARQSWESDRANLAGRQLRAEATDPTTARPAAAPPTLLDVSTPRCPPPPHPPPPFPSFSSALSHPSHMAKRTSRASGSAGRKVFSASSASSSRPKASAGAAEHYAFRHAKNQSSSHGGSEVGGVIDLIEADPLDTYALSVKKHKRANVSSALTREEEAPGPGGGGGGRRAKRRADAADDESGRSDDDDDGVEDGEAVRERLRKLVNSHELLELEAGSEDEELDSDSAFEDDDEGRGWAAAFVHKAKGRRGKQPSKGKKVRSPPFAHPILSASDPLGSQRGRFRTGSSLLTFSFPGRLRPLRPPRTTRTSTSICPRANRLPSRDGRFPPPPPPPATRATRRTLSRTKRAAKGSST